MPATLPTLRWAALLLAALALAYHASNAVVPGLLHFSSGSPTRSTVSGMRDGGADMTSQAVSLSPPGWCSHRLQEGSGGAMCVVEVESRSRKFETGDGAPRGLHNSHHCR